MELRVVPANDNIIPAGYHLYVVPKGGNWDRHTTIQDADISWDFGDPSSKFENYHEDMILPNNANWQLGAYVTKVYQTEGGERTITARVNRPNLPEVILTAKVTPVEQSTVAFDLDIAVSFNGDFEDVPAGVKRITTEASFYKEMYKVNDVNAARVRFRAGETFVLPRTYSLKSTDNVIWDRFGPSDKSFIQNADPVVRTDRPSIGGNPWDSVKVLWHKGSNPTVNNIQFLTNYNPVTGQLFEGKPVPIRTSGKDVRIVMNKCRIIGANIAVYMLHGSSMIFNDSIIEDYSNYGLLCSANHNEASISMTGGWINQHVDSVSTDGKGLSQEFDTPDHGTARFSTFNNMNVYGIHFRSLNGWFGKGEERPAQPWLRCMLDTPNAETGNFKIINIHNVVANQNIALQRQNGSKHIYHGVAMSVEALYGYSTAHSGGVAYLEVGGSTFRNCIFVHDDMYDRTDQVEGLSMGKFQNFMTYGGHAEGSEVEARMRTTRLMNITAINLQGKDKNPAHFYGMVRRKKNDTTEMSTPIITNSILHAPHVPNGVDYADVMPLDPDNLYAAMRGAEGYQSATGSFDDLSMARRDFFGNVRGANSSKGAVELAA